MKALLDGDPGMAVWWGSRVECWSEFARLRRDGLFSVESEEVGTPAGRLLRVHAIRAAHALQLAAALAWRGDSPSGEIVAYDHRLREAARLENLILRP